MSIKENFAAVLEIITKYISQPTRYIFSLHCLLIITLYIISTSADYIQSKAIPLTNTEIYGLVFIYNMIPFVFISFIVLKFIEIIDQFFLDNPIDCFEDEEDIDEAYLDSTITISTKEFIFIVAITALSAAAITLTWHSFFGFAERLYRSAYLADNIYSIQIISL